MKYFIISCALLCAFTQGAVAQEKWQFSIGAASLYRPNFIGDDTSQFLLLPNATARFGTQFEASFAEGIKYKLLESQRIEAGPRLTYDSGRMSRELRNAGFADIGFTLEAGGFADITLGAFYSDIELLKAIAGGYDGLSGDAEVGLRGRFQNRLFYKIGVRARLGDNSFNTQFFGVNKAQSNATGLPQFNAPSGVISNAVRFSIFAPLGERALIRAFVTFETLSSNIAHSPIITRFGSQYQQNFAALYEYQL